jgi:hypothetical protein
MPHAAVLFACPSARMGAPSDEWIAEANRRSDLFDSGEISGSSWSDVRQRARRKAGLDG